MLAGPSAEERPELAPGLDAVERGLGGLRVP